MTSHFDQDDRYLLGEIHSDVKTLLEHRLSIDKRVTSLERNRWYQRGFLLGIGGLLIAKFPILSGVFK